MKSLRAFSLFTGALALGLAFVTAPTARAGHDSKKERLVRVDCSDADPKKHDSIRRALRKKAKELTIEIDGMCVEDVVIQRDLVTLRGRNQDAGVDGIEGASPGRILGGTGAREIGEGVVLVRGGLGVRLEHLFIGEGLANRSGVIATNEAILTLESCRIENNPGFGVAIAGASVFVDDTAIAGNGAAAAGTSNGGHLTVTDSALQGGLLSVFTGLVEMTGGSLSGPVFSLTHSSVTLDGVVHSGPTDFHVVAAESSLFNLGSSLEGVALVSDFASLVLRNGGSLDGNLVCQAAGDAFCANPSTDVSGTANCTQCLKP